MGMKKTELGERLKEAAKAAECAVADLKKLAIDALEKERLDVCLRTLALAKTTAGYAEVGELVGAFAGSPRFTVLLAQQMERDASAGGPFYCALLRQGDSGMPSPAFFERARELGFVFESGTKKEAVESK